MLKPIRANSGLVEVKIPLQLPRIPGDVSSQGKSFLLLTISKVGRGDIICTEIPFLNHLRVSYQNTSEQKPDIIHAEDYWTDIFKEFEDYGIPDFVKFREFFEKTWVLVRVVSCSAVDVQFLVDTNSHHFKGLVPDEFVINLNCRRMDLNIPFHGISNPIRIDLGGGRHPVPSSNNPSAFRPVVSIDFGNQSTVAAIQSSTDQLPDYKLVHLDSIVGLISINSKPDSKNGHEYLCVGRSPKEHYFREGVQFVTGGQFQGYNAVTQKPACDLKMAHKFPKRALTHPDAEIDLGKDWDFKLAGNVQSLERMKIHSRMTVQGSDGFVLAPKRLSAELFLTDLLERVSGLEIDSIPERVGTPAGLVLTHPTTYGAKEIMLLKKAVTRAFLRRKNITPCKEPNENNGIEHEGMPKKKLGRAFNPGFKCESIVDGVIDEASAAAYYYLRKHVISDKTFGIRGFRVLHPEGTRIIIVDCGAGTTDVASFTIKTNHEGEKLRLDAELEGLTGDQVFCGDLITRKIGRLIRAKLYSLYLSKKQNPNGLKFKPNNSWSDFGIDLDRDLSDFLAEYEGGPNRGKFPLIDTTFLPNDQYLESKMTRLGFFVKEAERIKVAIGEFIRKGNKDDQVRKVHLDNAFINKITKDAVPELDNIGSIFIDDQEIKCLVEKDLRRLASTINQAMLLPANKSKLGDYCVSKVLLTGKGSLYPLLGTILREDLSLVDPSKQVQELFELEHGAIAPETALKNCVSIGACWWWADANANGPEIKFISQRQNKLPFDLCVKDGNVNLPKVIFKEGTLYTEMVNRAPGSILEFDNPVTQITLYRRFPGCPDYQPFLDFGFDGEGVYNVSISWNEDDLEFDVSGDGNGWHSKNRPDGLTSQYFLSPLWSGTL